ncbi:hypothetical protein ACHAXT_011779 [Thalassiosira profunda]
MARRFVVGTAACLLLALMVPAAAAFSASKKLALITGGNKGIGKEIARRIGTEPDFTALIACRDVELGRKAAKDLRRENGEYLCDAVILPVPLDLDDADSIAGAAKWVEKEYGGVLDVLVNNAAVCFNDPTLYGRVEYTPFEKQAGITIRTNYFGTLGVTEAFLPMLKKAESPRIINVASAAGRLTILRSQELADEFTSDDLTIPRLSELMQQFVSDVEGGTHAQKGWPNTGYGVSKLGIIALTRILAREYPEMMINSADPGYCRTDQNDNQGTVDPADGAYTPYLLALMERDEEGEEADSGLHFYEEGEMPWTYQR